MNKKMQKFAQDTAIQSAVENMELVTLEKLKTMDGSIFDCCYELCEMFFNEELDVQVSCVRTLCQNYGIVSSNKTKIIKKYVTDDIIEELKDQFGDFVNESISMMLKKAYKNGWEEKDFYSALWSCFQNRDIFSNHLDLTFALYYIAIDRRVPFFHLDTGTEMNNDEYSDIYEKNEKRIRKIRFILYSKFSQKTEEASLILKEIFDAETYDDQLIMLSAVIDTLNKEKMRYKKLINDMLSNAQ